MLVLQCIYESLVQSGFIYEGLVGLVKYGRYTHGYNVDNVVNVRNDELTTIGLTIPLVNIVNITVGLLVGTILVIIGIFIYESVSVKIERDK